MAPTRTVSKPLERGSLVRVRYRDHNLVRNGDPERAGPVEKRAVGQLDRETEDYVFLVVDEYTVRGPDGVPVRKATGLVILKQNILEVERLA